jgi:hypothetical protein
MDVSIIIFDLKLNGLPKSQMQLKRQINKALTALNLFTCYLNPQVIRTLVLLIRNYYSFLYYNAELWLTQNLNSKSKQHLLLALANALGMCMPMLNPCISFYGPQPPSK